MREFAKLAAVTASAVSLGVLGSASAASVSFSDITASWINTSPSSAWINTSDNGTANPSLNWGQPASSSGQSGYDFQASSDFSATVPPGGEFELGEFTHRNYPVYAPVVTDTTLQVGINVSVDGGVAQLFQFFFDFSHLETDNGLNVCPNGGSNYSGVNSNGCADRVTISNTSVSETFEVDGVLYTIAVTGFKAGADIISEFWTKENRSNSAILMATITSDLIPNEVPLPAALPLFLAGVAGMGFASRRRNKTAK